MALGDPPILKMKATSNRYQCRSTRKEWKIKVEELQDQQDLRRRERKLVSEPRGHGIIWEIWDSGPGFHEPVLTQELSMENVGIIILPLTCLMLSRFLSRKAQVVEQSTHGYDKSNEGGLS